MTSSHAYYNEVLPDFERRTTGQQLCSDIANPELILDRCWFHSAVRCYLAEGDEAGPKPNARHRLSTFWFIMGMDAMLRHCTGAGFERFRTAATKLLPEGQANRADLCPASLDGKPYLLSVCVDQCSVGWAAGYFLRYEMKLNVEFVMDPSHRFWRDIKLALGDARLWHVILMLGIPWNVNYGPWMQSSFFLKVQDAAKDYVGSVSEGAHCPLFQAALPAIARDRGEEHMVGSDAWAKARFQELATGKAVSSKGPKMSLCRWASALDVHAYWDEAWHERVVILMYWGLSLGYVKKGTDTSWGPSLRLSGLHKPAAGEASGKKESIREAQLKAQVSRDGARNTLHAALIVLSDAPLQRKMRIISAVCAPMRSWHGKSAKDMRDPASCLAHYTVQAAGGCLDSIFETFQSLSKPGDLHHCGFLLDPSDWDASGGQESEQVLLDSEDSWLQMAVGLAFTVVKHRMRSYMFYLEGIPASLATAFSDDELVRETTLNKLKETHAAYSAASECAQRSPWVGRCVARSHLTPPVAQYALNEMHAAGFLEFPNHVKDMVAGMLAVGNTKIIEDCIQRVRHAEDMNQSNRNISSKRCWYTAIQREVMTKVHRMPEIRHSACEAHREKDLPRTVPIGHFSAKANVQQLPLKSVSGASSKPAWTTLSPVSGIVQYADLAVWRDCLVSGAWGQVNSSWLCHAMSCGMLVKRVGTSRFCWALGQYEHTAAIGWGTHEETIGGVRYYWPLCEKQGGECPYEWLICTNLKQWVCQPFVWRSPARQTDRTHAPATLASSGSSAGPPTTRFLCAAQAVGEPVPLLTACAMNAFKDFNELLFTRLCRVVGIPISSGSSFFEKLKLAMKHVVPSMSDEAMLELLHARCLREETIDEGFFDIDEVKACYDPGDLREVEKAVETSRDEVPQSFKDELVAFGQEVYTSKAQHKSKKQRVKKELAVVSQLRRSVTPVEASQLTIDVARQCLPPSGAHICKDHVNNRWLVHHKPFGRLSRSWTCYGEVESYCRVACWAWQNHEAVTGETCPFEWIKVADWRL